MTQGVLEIVGKSCRPCADGRTPKLLDTPARPTSIRKHDHIPCHHGYQLLHFLDQTRASFIWSIFTDLIQDERCYLERERRIPRKSGVIVSIIQLYPLRQNYANPRTGPIGDAVCPLRTPSAEILARDVCGSIRCIQDGCPMVCAPRTGDLLGPEESCL